MLRSISYAALIGAALLAAPAFAETTNDAFVKQQAIDQWRASKLAGVSVLGADQKTPIRSIKDVLIDHNRNAQARGIGVRGLPRLSPKNTPLPIQTLHTR